MALIANNSFIRSMGQRDRKSPGFKADQRCQNDLARNERITKVVVRQTERKEYSLRLVDSLGQHTGGQELYSGRRSKLR